MNAPARETAPMVRTRVLAVLDSDKDVMRCYLSGGQHEANDLKLTRLTALAGRLADSALMAESQNWSRIFLHKILGYASGWVVSLGMTWVQPAISAERDRQDHLFRSGKHQFSCTSPIVDVARKFRVLMEEIGEVAEAIDRLEATSKPHNATAAIMHLTRELIQVAAVTTAWLESLETPGSSTKGEKAS